MAHKFNVLRLWVKICSTQLSGCFWPNVDDPSSSSYDPTVVLEPMVQPTLCVESLSNNGGKVAFPFECNDNGGASIYGWNNLCLSGSMTKWMEWLILGGDCCGKCEVS